MTVYDSGVVLGFLIGLAVLIACIVWIVKDVFGIISIIKQIHYFEKATKALEKEKE